MQRKLFSALKKGSPPDRIVQWSRLHAIREREVDEAFTEHYVSIFDLSMKAMSSGLSLEYDRREKMAL